MSYTAYSIPEALHRLRIYDPSLKCINLSFNDYPDGKLIAVVDCLLAHPDVVTEVYLSDNRLTDQTGIKLARYLVVSSTIRELVLSDNYFGEATYRSIAAALHVNSSLWRLSLSRNRQAVCKARIDAAFVDALILNPNRPAQSEWCLYSWDDFSQLKEIAEQQGHPSMQAILTLQVFGVLYLDL